jgi:glycosyltransferase involved in cell wall biosynthesis
MNDSRTWKTRQLLISVVVATRNRAETLRSTLAAMQDLLPREGWELIVVDNASTDHTASVLASMQARLPLLALYEAHPGKSRAINYALGSTRGRLVIFTDDDVKPARSWLLEYERAYYEHPSVNIFCGPIRCVFPREAPDWLANCPHASPLFGRFEPQPAEGFLTPGWLPFGGNFAVRSRSLQGMKLNENLGPPRPIMGEDTDLLLRLTGQSPKIVYMPGAGVDHRIRLEQLVPASAFGRAFVCGTSIVAVMDTIDIVPSLPSYVDAEEQVFNLGADLNYSYGQIYQLSRRGDDPRLKTLADHISALNWSGDPALLGSRARLWLAQNPEHVPDAARPAFLEVVESSRELAMSLSTAPEAAEA